MAISLSAAQGAIKAISSDKVLSGAYRAYASGHDDKHRNKAKAYSYNFISGDGNEPSSFFQKVTTAHVPVLDENKQPVFKEVTSSAWGSTTTSKVQVTRPVQQYSDISQDQERELLKAAFAGKPPIYYRDNRDPNNKFLFACYIPSGFAGYTFSGGGQQFPKQASACDAMVIVMSRGSNVHIVTHYPTMISTIQNWTRLT